MNRLLAHALFLAPALAAGVAAAHPGHGTPHLLNEGDAVLGWWMFATFATVAAVAWWLGKSRP